MTSSIIRLRRETFIIGLQLKVLSHIAILGRTIRCQLGVQQLLRLSLYRDWVRYEWSPWWCRQCLNMAIWLNWCNALTNWAMKSHLEAMVISKWVHQCHSEVYDRDRTNSVSIIVHFRCKQWRYEWSSRRCWQFTYFPTNQLGNISILGKGHLYWVHQFPSELYIDYLDWVCTTV